jgi:hypothetical protein
MGMRDSIAQIIASSGLVPEWRSWDDLLPETRKHYQMHADAILAALPDMIAPLVWKAGDGVTADEEYFTANAVTGGEYWTIEGELGCSFDMGSFYEVDFSSHTEAKAAANTHHRAAIMAAFTGETQ